MADESLPIVGFRNEIIHAIATNDVTVIVAETGAGKSTQVPQYLLEEGYEVIVSQPRRLAAFSVAQRVAEEVGCEFGSVVGFRTARERLDSRDTRCLYVTDGLALVRELMETTPRSSRRILVLDEVHEWNLNIETLVAWAKAQIAKGVDYKLVLMSATLEAEALAKHFADASVIFVPGRLFAVEIQQPAETLVEDVVRLVGEGRNILVFQPGKAEIEATITELHIRGVDAEIFPLHGALAHVEQQKCFAHYDRPKVVVSTNIAQTSITIDDIDAVVDSGMERRIELVHGVEGLYIRSISMSDSKQRAGRAGRTKPGVYIDHCKDTERLEFPVAEIMRVHLDQTVLRLARVECNMEELSFFHQPQLSKITAARKKLCALGCMGGDGTVTDIGIKVSQLPVSVRPGRMIVEAMTLGVLGDIITVAAIFEIGALHARKDEQGNPSSTWRVHVGDEKESDVIAQLRLFEAGGKIVPFELHKKGIHPTAYIQAKELQVHIRSVLERLGFAISSSGNRKDILRAVCAGMTDSLYRVRHDELVASDRRKPSRDSVVIGKEWVVGLPFDLEVVTREGGKKIFHLVHMITSVTLEMLGDAAPQFAGSRSE